MRLLSLPLPREETEAQDLFCLESHSSGLAEPGQRRVAAFLVQKRSTMIKTTASVLWYLLGCQTPDSRFIQRSIPFIL